MQTGISAASVRRDKTGPPSLQRLEWLPEATEGQPQESFSSLVRRAKWQHFRTVSVLPPDSYELMQIELAELPAEERREAARWQVREMLDFPVEQAVVDLFEVAPYGSDNKPLTYVVAAQEQQLRALVAQLSEAELSLTAIDIPEFALRNIAELFAEDERGTAILLLQEQDGLLTIVRDGVQYLSRSLPIGMNQLLPYADGDFEALSEQLDMIVLEMQRTFDYCESSFRLPMVSRILVAQTQREIPAVYPYLNDYLTTSVEPLRLDAVLSLPAGIEQLELNRHLLAIGGALRREVD